MLKNLYSSLFIKSKSKAKILFKYSRISVLLCKKLQKEGIIRYFTVKNPRGHAFPVIKIYPSNSLNGYKIISSELFLDYSSKTSGFQNLAIRLVSNSNDGVCFKVIGKSLLFLR